MECSEIPHILFTTDDFINAEPKATVDGIQTQTIQIYQGFDTCRETGKGLYVE